MIPHRVKRLWMLLLLPLVLGLVGCPFSPEKKGGNDDEPDVSEYKALITIPNVLYNLKLAYEELNYDEYAKLLDPSFRFRFDPRDVGPDQPWQELEWGIGEELDAHRHMFDGEPNIDRALLAAKADELERMVRRLGAVIEGLRHAAVCPAASHAACPSFQRLLKAAAAGALQGRGRRLQPRRR